MKRFVLWAWAAALTVGCNSVENAMTVVEPALPDDEATCTFKADGAESMLQVTFDPKLQSTLSLMLRVKNNLQPTDVDFSNEGPSEESYKTPKRITPLRWDFRWECDSEGFGPDQGAPIYLPHFSATEAFCLDRRNETTGNFVGFDVISATGSAFEEWGLAQIRPITVQLGIAIYDFFNLASLANLCCDEVGGCSNLDQAQTSGTGSCASLQAAFDAIAGTGVLNVTKEADVRRWQPFSVYDFENNAVGSMLPATGSGVTVVGPSYPMRMRGILEGITETGDLVTSNEYAVDIHICRGCGGGRPCTAF